MAEPTQTATATGVTAKPADLPGDGIGLVIGPATPGTVALEAEAVTPETTGPVAVAPVHVQGPPAGSAFRRSDVVSFYWQWPEDIDPGQRFALYLTVDGERLLLGTVAEPNLGRGYQLQAAVGEAAGEVGRFAWQVELQDEAVGAALAQSEARGLTILAD